MSDSKTELESRVLLLAPTPSDGSFTEKLFKDVNISTRICRSMHEVCDETVRGAGMLVLTAETIDAAEFSILSKILRDQPPWSDLPVLLLMSPSTQGLQFSEHLRDFHSITYLKRPVEVVALLTAVQSGLRDRQRQYAVREHLIERERHSQALLDADRRKDEFLATLAHELRNPLSPLRSGIDLLRMEDDDNEERQSILQMMDRQLHQMVRLVDDLLDVSRITRDKLTLAADLVEVQSIVKASIETTRQMISNSRITLKTFIPLEPVYVRGDSTRLTQVVSNLLNNAVKYSEDSSEIELRITRCDHEVQISVRDSGIGIPSEMLSRVFEMFTQVDSSLTRARGGLGIGLTLVRRIVEMHAGRVTASSDGSGKGSEFRVFLPLAEATAGEIGEQYQNDWPNFVPRRILIVDDTRAARTMLARLLLKLGHEVFECESGQDALMKIDSICPDVVISDIGMPGMDGYELAKALRTHRCCKSTYMVALTGYGQESDRVRAIESGFDCHLVKPVSYAVLQRTLSQTAGL